jgi:hypothetical protein
VSGGNPNPISIDSLRERSEGMNESEPSLVTAKTSVMMVPWRGPAVISNCLLKRRPPGKRSSLANLPSSLTWYVTRSPSVLIRYS